MVLQPAFYDCFLVVFELSDFWKLAENIVQLMVLVFLAILPFFIVSRYIIAPDRLIIFDDLLNLGLVMIGLLVNELPVVVKDFFLPYFFGRSFVLHLHHWAV